MKPTLKYYWPAILWALFVLTLCSIKLGKVEGSPLFFPGFDKLAHCGFFFVMVVLFCNAYIRQQFTGSISYTSTTIITALAVLYGGLIELLQLYVFTWRDGNWPDFFADSVGAFMGAFSIFLTVKTVNYVKK